VLGNTGQGRKHILIGLGASVLAQIEEKNTKTHPQSEENKKGIVQEKSLERTYTMAKTLCR